MGNLVLIQADRDKTLNDTILPVRRSKSGS